MFSTALKFHPSSRLYHKMPLLQHIVALSVVSAIRTISGYEVGTLVCVCLCVCVCVMCVSVCVMCVSVCVICVCVRDVCVCV